MEPKELSNMRWNQLVVTNGLMVTTWIIFFIIITIFSIPYKHFFLVLGVLMFIYAVYGFIKGDSTNRMLPIFEKVAIYEKQKMGNEWYKQERVGHIWQLILSCFLFFQSYLSRDATDNIQMEPMLTFILVVVSLVMINISLMIHFRKVDHSTSVLNMKGYTWKSNLIGVVIGIICGVVMIVIMVSYIISGI